MNFEPLIYVTNLKDSIKFYTKILGFRLGSLYPNQESPTYAPIFIGDRKFMLVVARETNKRFYPKGLGGSGVQFFIQVQDVNAVWDRLKDKVKIFDKIETKSWGDREFTIKDPDGYLLSFYTPTN